VFRREGERFDDYRLVSLLGQGTFGEVYVAKHLYDHEQVAIKILKFRLTVETIPGFLREARLIRLKHAHIVPLLDFGIAQDGLTPFLVMAYIHNGTLRQRHPPGTRVPLAQVVTYVQQIASALQYAHECRVIHRDVKPENILLDAQQNLLLSDFGIAAIAHSEQSMQRAQEMAGTFAYMAPEQIEGRPRPASDQYALGIMVYEWLCGTRPFHGTATELLAQHCNAPPPPLHSYISGLPANVESVVLKALAKDPRERYASVQDFALAFAHAYAHPTSPMRMKPTSVESASRLHTVSANKPGPGTPEYPPPPNVQAMLTPPRSSASWLQQGDTLFVAGRYKEALAAYNRALLINPNDAFVYSGRSLILYKLKRYSEGLAACDYAIQLDPSFAPPYHTRGLILEKLGRLKEANLAFEKARALGYRG
jgi:serine/threonine protein kinase